MISVIVPTAGDGAGLGPTLGALTPGLMTGLLREVIFADAGGVPAIAEIADACGAELLSAPGPLGARLAAAAAGAKGPWLLFLPAEAVMSEDWPRAARALIEQGDRRAGWFPLGGRGAAAANLRARLGRPTDSHPLLLSRRLYREAGPHPARDRGAAAALAARIGRGRLIRLDASARLSAP